MPHNVVYGFDPVVYDVLLNFEKKCTIIILYKDVYK